MQAFSKWLAAIFLLPMLFFSPSRSIQLSLKPSEQKKNEMVGDDTGNVTERMQKSLFRSDAVALEPHAHPMKKTKIPNDDLETSGSKIINFFRARVEDFIGTEVEEPDGVDSLQFTKLTNPSPLSISNRELQKRTSIQPNRRKHTSLGASSNMAHPVNQPKSARRRNNVNTKRRRNDSADQKILTVKMKDLPTADKIIQQNKQFAPYTDFNSLQNTANPYSLLQQYNILKGSTDAYPSLFGNSASSSTYGLNHNPIHPLYNSNSILPMSTLSQPSPSIYSLLQPSTSSGSILQSAPQFDSQWQNMQPSTRFSSHSTPQFDSQWPKITSSVFADDLNGQRNIGSNVFSSQSLPGISLLDSYLNQGENTLGTRHFSSPFSDISSIGFQSTKTREEPDFLSPFDPSNDPTLSPNNYQQVVSNLFNYPKPVQSAFNIPDFLNDTIYGFANSDDHKTSKDRDIPTIINHIHIISPKSEEPESKSLNASPQIFVNGMLQHDDQNNQDNEFNEYVATRKNPYDQFSSSNLHSEQTANPTIKSATDLNLTIYLDNNMKPIRSDVIHTDNKKQKIENETGFFSSLRKLFRQNGDANRKKDVEPHSSESMPGKFENLIQSLDDEAFNAFISAVKFNSIVDEWMRRRSEGKLNHAFNVNDVRVSRRYGVEPIPDDEDPLMDQLVDKFITKLFEEYPQVASQLTSGKPIIPTTENTLGFLQQYDNSYVYAGLKYFVDSINNFNNQYSGKVRQWTETMGRLLTEKFINSIDVSQDVRENLNKYINEFQLQNDKNIKRTDDSDEYYRNDNMNSYDSKVISTTIKDNIELSTAEHHGNSTGVMFAGDLLHNVGNVLGLVDSVEHEVNSGHEEDYRGGHYQSVSNPFKLVRNMVKTNLAGFVDAHGQLFDYLGQTAFERARKLRGEKDPPRVGDGSEGRSLYGSKGVGTVDNYGTGGTWPLSMGSIGALGEKNVNFVSAPIGFGTGYLYADYPSESYETDGHNNNKQHVVQNARKSVNNENKNDFRFSYGSKGNHGISNDVNNGKSKMILPLKGSENIKNHSIRQYNLNLGNTAGRSSVAHQNVRKENIAGLSSGYAHISMENSNSNIGKNRTRAAKNTKSKTYEESKYLSDHLYESKGHVQYEQKDRFRYPRVSTRNHNLRNINTNKNHKYSGSNNYDRTDDVDGRVANNIQEYKSENHWYSTPYNSGNNFRTETYKRKRLNNDREKQHSFTNRSEKNNEKRSINKSESNDRRAPVNGYADDNTAQRSGNEKYSTRQRDESFDFEYDTDYFMKYNDHHKDHHVNRATDVPEQYRYKHFRGSTFNRGSSKKAGERPEYIHDTTLSNTKENRSYKQTRGSILENRKSNKKLDIEKHKPYLGHRNDSMKQTIFDDGKVIINLEYPIYKLYETIPIHKNYGPPYLESDKRMINQPAITFLKPEVSNPEADVIKESFRDLKDFLLQQQKLLADKRQSDAVNRKIIGNTNEEDNHRRKEDNTNEEDNHRRKVHNENSDMHQRDLSHTYKKNVLRDDSADFYRVHDHPEFGTLSRSRTRISSEGEFFDQTKNGFLHNIPRNFRKVEPSGHLPLQELFENDQFKYKRLLNPSVRFNIDPLNSRRQSSQSKERSFDRISAELIRKHRKREYLREKRNNN